eukprot:4117473-Prymnesium_polylepis.2
MPSIGVTPLGPVVPQNRASASVSWSYLQFPYGSGSMSKCTTCAGTAAVLLLHSTPRANNRVLGSQTAGCTRPAAHRGLRPLQSDMLEVVSAVQVELLAQLEAVVELSVVQAVYRRSCWRWWHRTRRWGQVGADLPGDEQIKVV